MKSHHPIEKKHISELCTGDTVIVNGAQYTVGRDDVKNGYTGWTFRGDPYPFTRGMVDVVVWRKEK
jgi:tartrate dehydratase beta subunit/fumarate hydratase class I family protein